MHSMKKRIETLGRGESVLVVAPQIEHIMTGAISVSVKHNGTIEVVYTDGVVERRTGKKFLEKIDAENPSLFALVGFVQETRARR